MELNDSDIPENASLCSLHFADNDLDRTSLSCTRIRSDAVPVVCIDVELSQSKIIASISYFVRVCICTEKCKYEN